MTIKESELDELEAKIETILAANIGQIRLGNGRLLSGRQQARLKVLANELRNTSMLLSDEAIADIPLFRVCDALQHFRESQP